MPKPSPMSNAVVVSMSSSGTSLSVSATRKPITATGAAHRNTRPSESEYASTIGAATESGSWWSTCGDWAAAGGAPLAANAPAIRLSRKFANNDPKTAAPKELPMVRKNVTPDVATPRSEKLAVLCTMSTRTCMHIPMPVPRMNRYALCCSTGVVASICDSRTKPSVITAVPTTGKTL